ncbi:MAG: hypothetical protein ABIW81_02635 [Terrimesophilobacter sp.]
MAKPVRERDKTLIVILAIIGAAVVIAIAVVFLRGAPETLDPTTPEGVVQAYSVAVLDQDRPSALSHLVPELAKDCVHTDAGLDGLTMTLVSSTVRATSATVRVTLTTNSSKGPLGSSEYSNAESFTLQKVGNVWLIDTTPWRLTICYPKEG